MLPLLRRPERLWRALTVVVLAACSRPDAARGVDTAPDTATAVIPAGAPPSRWASELGSLLLVPSDDSSAVVIFPEGATLRADSRPVVLVTSSGDTMSTTMTPAPADSQVCGEAPTVRLGSTTAVAWNAGLRGGSAMPVRVDSLESITPNDSVRLSADLARLASRVPMSVDSRFKGLPFVVFSARRFAIDSMSVVVGYLVRRIPNEATPAEEHTMLVAERGSGTGAAYSIVFHERSEGTEDTADHFELLAALRTRDAVWLLVSRDNVAQTTYELLHRGAQRWSVRWSRVLSC